MRTQGDKENASLSFKKIDSFVFQIQSMQCFFMKREAVRECSLICWEPAEPLSPLTVPRCPNTRVFLCCSRDDKQKARGECTDLSSECP